MVGCEDDLVSIASYYTASTTTRPGLERNNSLSRITPLDPSTVKVVVPTKPQRRSAKADSNAASVSSYDNGDSITIATSSTKSSHCTSAEPPMRPTLQRNSSLARITPIASSTVKVTTPTTSKPHRRTSISGGESVCTYKYDRDQEDAQSVASKRPTVQRNPSFSRITPIDSSAVKVTIPIQMTATPKRRPSIGSTSSLLCSAPSASNTPTCCVACKEKDDEQNKLVVENEQLKAQVQQLKQLLASVTKQQRAL